MPIIKSINFKNDGIDFHQFHIASINHDETLSEQNLEYLFDLFKPKTGKNDDKREITVKDAENLVNSKKWEEKF